MRIRTAMVTLAATGLVGGGLLATPAQASPSAKWIPAPLSTLESVVKSINASAKANKEPRHSPGCFSALSLSGNRNFLAVSLQPKANVDACGSPTDFGVQAYRKSGSKWLHVGGSRGPAGTSCVFTKVTTASDKRLLKSSGMCR